MPGGRPSTYSKKKAEEICRLLSGGKSLRKICEMPGMPSREAVYSWLFSQQEFADQYALAREIQADYYSEQCLEIADDGTNDTYELEDGSKKVAHDHIQRSRLRVDTRKWIASQMAPKKWGIQSVKQEISGPNGGPVQLQAVDGPPQETREEWISRKRLETQQRSLEVPQQLLTNGVKK